uniref:Uncharacterized protein n=1 Tax=Myotis myotis TaxID=51298 RepID=A0A7J7QX54_MYOMY|nr:hypothetical protein mMyoMyo1_011283 [Myotis myotis]
MRSEHECLLMCLLIFREREKELETSMKETATWISCLPHAPCWGTESTVPGMCPDQSSAGNLGAEVDAQPLSHTSQAVLFCLFYNIFLLISERKGKREREKHPRQERIMDRLPPASPSLGIEPTTHTCALARN